MSSVVLISCFVGSMTGVFLYNQCRALKEWEKHGLQGFTFDPKKKIVSVYAQREAFGFYPVFYEWSYPCNSNSWQLAISSNHKLWMEFELRHPWARHILRPLVYGSHIPAPKVTSLLRHVLF